MPRVLKIKHHKTLTFEMKFKIISHEKIGLFQYECFYHNSDTTTTCFALAESNVIILITVTASQKRGFTYSNHNLWNPTFLQQFSFLIEDGPFLFLTGLICCTLSTIFENWWSWWHDIWELWWANCALKTHQHRENTQSKNILQD